MELNGETRIEASREAVWAALNDPNVLRQVIPGCESLETTEDGGLQAKVVLKVGPIKAKFGGAVTFSEVEAPEGYVISGQGEGGIAGFAKGGARVRLAEESPNVTILTYEARADVGGKVAQLGARMLDSTARKLTSQFFEKFATVVVAGPEKIAV
ncbi:CoxG family protein [Agrobacterium pusense]|uniref:CoxG family protein n=1 Tax=Agrobacterium pusense TaxID=648995 RepID=UPI003FCF1001